MKKLLTALGAAAVIATMTMPVSAEKLWKYSETVTIDLAEALKHGTSRPPMATTYWNSLQ